MNRSPSIANSSAWRSAWSVRADTTYLNHGSFGPPPNCVRQRQAEWKQQLDDQPMDFFVRSFEPAWFDARRALAEFVGTNADHLAFVDNATYGMNVVAQSLPLLPGDEVLLTDHEYGAVKRIWERACAGAQAQVVVAKLPLPIDSAAELIDAIFAKVNARTRLLVVSHVTSPTAVTLPILEIVRRAKSVGVAVCVDGPHAPAYTDLRLDDLACDFYVASCHKWLSAPLGSGFLYVAPQHQSLIRTPILSWGRLLPRVPETWYDPFVWCGTRDPSPYFTVPTAIEFLRGVGLDEFRRTTHDLARSARQRIAERFGTTPMTPDAPEWYGSMAHVPLPSGDCYRLQDALWQQYGIEVPIVSWQDQRYVRVSCHLYNDQHDLDKLVGALDALIQRGA